MNNKLIAIAAANDLDLPSFKAYANKFQWRYGKIVGGFLKPRKHTNVNELVKDFVEFSNPNRFLQTDDIDGLTIKTRKGVWFASIESIECYNITWTSKKSKDTIYATPNWDNEGEVPVNVVLEGDEYGGYDATTIKFPEGMPLAKQKKLYLSIVKSVIETL